MSENEQAELAYRLLISLEEGWPKMYSPTSDPAFSEASRGRRGSRKSIDRTIYYEQRREGLGQEFEDAIRQSLNAIRQAPERNAFRKDGIRRHVVHRFHS